jgi:hypothetical protein
MVLLLLLWFLAHHLTITTGGQSAATPDRSAPAGAGFPQTEAGAVDAATFYLTQLDGPLVLDPDKLAAFERQAGSGNYAEQLVKDSQEAAAQLESTYGLRTAQQRGLRVALQPQPLAYRVTSPWNGWSASVAVWWIELVAIDGVTSTIALWQTTTISLVWDDQAWHITQLATEAGPGPEGDNPQLPEQLRDFQRYRHVV